MRTSFWKVEQALLNIKNYPAYFLGGSLCIDFEYHPSVVLNQDGRGFFYKDGKVKKFVMTDKLRELVRGIHNVSGIPSQQLINNVYPEKKNEI